MKQTKSTDMMAAIPSKTFTVLGRLQFGLFKIPIIGEPLVRALNRGLAHLAYYLPLLGSKKSRTVHELQNQWFGFLNSAGIHPTVTQKNDREFFWSMVTCPYGFKAPNERGVCDAVMDLDRTYTRLLGGELEILERIPDGAPCCRYVTRLHVS